MRRFALCAFALLLAACGEAADTPAAGSAATGVAVAGPVEARLVADDSAVRQRLTPAQLLTYFPPTVGAREPNLDGRYLHDTPGEVGSSVVNVRYIAYAGGTSSLLELGASDLIDDPEFLARERATVEDGEGLDPYGTGTIEPSRAVTNGIGRAFTTDGGMPYVYIVLADRFAVKLRADDRDGDVTTDDLWELYEASGLARLAGAPTYEDMGAPDVPAWAADAVAEWEAEAAAEWEAEAVAEVAASPEPEVSRAPLMPCDVLLSASEVERVCGVSTVRVAPTFFEQEGENCSRYYKRGEGPSSGLVFLVSTFPDAATASRAYHVSIDVDNREGVRELDGLGGSSYKHYDNHIASFARGNVLVEMKASDNPLDQPGRKLCLDFDHLATLARGIADRLSE